MNSLNFSGLNPHCPMVFPWFSHGLPIVFPWFSAVAPRRSNFCLAAEFCGSSMVALCRSCSAALSSLSLGVIVHKSWWILMHTSMYIYIYIISYMYKKRNTYGVWNIVNMHIIAQVHLVYVYIYQIVYPCICWVWKNIDLFVDLLSYTEP